MTAPFRILVTGSRTWTDRGRINAELSSTFWRPEAAHRRVLLVHGDCPSGADRMARDWADRMRTGGGADVDHVPFPADWDRLRKRAGFARNADMVAFGADVVLAFARHCDLPGPCKYDGRTLPPGHFTHGTHDCITRAVGAGIELHTFLETS